MQNRRDKRPQPDTTPIHNPGLELPEFLFGLTFDTPATHTQTREVCRGELCVSRYGGQSRTQRAGSALRDINWGLLNGRGPAPTLLPSIEDGDGDENGPAPWPRPECYMYFTTSSVQAP